MVNAAESVLDREMVNVTPDPEDEGSEGSEEGGEADGGEGEGAGSDDGEGSESE